ncbi:MAG: 4a-hydroxytetrahydrobiopterin dehydratase [Thiomicrorhabdus sp.]|nr:4a-hydroxytetrahydrobiopterin dehydratase [Thiomicrorhabdus sp.]
MSTHSPIAETLSQQHCQEIVKGDKPLIIPAIESHLSQLPGWEAPISYADIRKTFSFKNYLQTISFVNAVTWIANKEDHYPTLSFDYNSVQISLNTQQIKGISLNDMILAAKINALLD